MVKIFQNLAFFPRCYSIHTWKLVCWTNKIDGRKLSGLFELIYYLRKKWLLTQLLNVLLQYSSITYYYIPKFQRIIPPNRLFLCSCYFCCRLKLFLEQFEISTCILNSELPAVSRIHALSQFNDGKYDIVITSDETDYCKESGENKNTNFKWGNMMDK